MSNTALAPARKGEEKPRRWTLAADGVPVNLAGITELKMHYRHWLSGGKTRTWNMLSTADVSPMLEITDPAGGVVTFTPTANFWQEGNYELYLEVIGLSSYSIPNTKNYTVIVTEGA